MPPSEFSICSKDFVNGCNNMDVTILPSEFSKKVLIDSAKKFNIELQTDVRI